MINKIDHIAIAVRSIEEAAKYYEEALGLKVERVEEVTSQKVKVAFIKVGETHIELLEPLSLDSTVAKFLDKNGPGVHHIAFCTDNVKEQLAKAKAEGVSLIHNEPFEGARDKLVAFLHPTSTFGVLTEFCETRGPIKESQKN